MNLRLLKRAIKYFSFLIFLVFPGVAYALDSFSKNAYLYDLTAQRIIFEKNADEAVPPGSLAKLMTLYLAFEFIQKGYLNLAEKLPVSKHAAAYGGATMFLNTNDRVAVEDLLRGIVILSGNDASAVIAEALSPDGTEAGFAKLMNIKAKQLNMGGTWFENSNGWPHPMQRTTARDLGLLATRIVEDFPEFYSMFSEAEFKFDGRAPANVRNRNPLLDKNLGVDGLKTGHSRDAGYSIVGSALQGKRRIIFVLIGFKSLQDRLSGSMQALRQVRFGDAWSEILQSEGESPEDLQLIPLDKLLDQISEELSFISDPVVLPRDPATPNIELDEKRTNTGSLFSQIKPRLRPVVESCDPDEKRTNTGSLLCQLKPRLRPTGESFSPRLKLGDTDQPITAERMLGFRDQLSACWAINVDSPAADIVVTLGLELNRDGTVDANSIVLISHSGGTSSDVRLAFAAARRAVLRCQKGGYNLPPEKYELWRKVEITFDPNIIKRQ